MDLSRKRTTIVIRAIDLRQHWRVSNAGCGTCGKCSTSSFPPRGASLSLTSGRRDVCPCANKINRTSEKKRSRFSEKYRTERWMAARGEKTCTRRKNIYLSKNALYKSHVKRSVFIGVHRKVFHSHVIDERMFYIWSPAEFRLNWPKAKLNPN